VKEEDDMETEAMLVESQLKLPEPPPPRGNYKAAVQHDSLLFVSGQFPLINGQLAYRGKLGRDLDVAEGYQAARLCAMNALAHIQKILISLDSIIGITRLEGYLQTIVGFQEHAKVLDGASDLFNQVLGERGTHTRAAFGVSSLPLDAPIEIVVTAQISRRERSFWRWLMNSSRNKEHALIKR
jgi:enamine deaminase RidA (YjgF/YER057c/UK114 family)